MAAQTLSASVASAIDILHDDITHLDFVNSESTTSFIKRIDVAFDLMNSRNPFGKGYKQPFTLSYHPNWSTEYEKLADYIFDLRDEEGHLLRNGRCKTVTWGFTFTPKSVKAITEELLQCSSMPYKYVLTYKFSQDHVHGFKLTLRRIIIRNSI